MPRAAKKEGGSAAKPGQALEQRPDFLIAMYGQLMGDINRHIIVVWQMLGALVASVAALVIAHKEGIPIAYVVLLTIFVSAWVIEHLYDSNYWYNRNLVMITNIERVFLTEDDLKNIHPYFAAHRSSNSFLAHLKIQRNYTIGLVLLILLYFTFSDVVETLSFGAKVDWLLVLPYFAFGWLVWKIGSVSDTYSGKYLDYLAISPGITVDRQIDFGATHGGRKKWYHIWPFVKVGSLKARGNKKKAVTK